MKRGKYQKVPARSNDRLAWLIIPATVLLLLVILALVAMVILAADLMQATNQILSADLPMPTRPSTTAANPPNPHQHDYGEESPVGKSHEGYVFSQTCATCGHVNQRTYAALVTFIDDDAKTEAILHWERIIDATGIEMTCALIPGKIGDTTDYDIWYSYAGWDLLDRMKEKGVDFIHHTYNHQRLSTFTEQQLHDDFRQSKEILSAHGIHSNLLVYPFYDHNDLVRQVTATYFDAAFGGPKDLSSDVAFSNYSIRRLKTTDPQALKTVTFPDGRVAECRDFKSSDTLKGELDQAVEAGDWLVYVTHAYNSPSGRYYFDETAEQSIIDFCQYAMKRDDVKIVSATNGYLAALPMN